MALTTYLITGASSGIGLELVRKLMSCPGNAVYATVRKRGNSSTGADLISAVSAVDGSSVHVIEGVDVSKDDVGEVLVPALAGTQVDVVVHNAGSMSATREVGAGEMIADQKLGAVSMDRMRAVFEVNALGPLRVQKALLDADLMRTNEGDESGIAGRVLVISTGLGSIGDNSSGGIYAYRASKAAVNMIFKSMSCDLKEKGISVRMIAPGFVATEFGGDKEKLKSWGAMPVEDSCVGILSLIDSMTMEGTGEFHSVQKDSTAKVMPW